MSWRLLTIQKKYSIFSAHNEGIRRAKGDNVLYALCMVAPYTKTEDWDTNVEKTFEDERIGNVSILEIIVCHINSKMHLRN